MGKPQSISFRGQVLVGTQLQQAVLAYGTLGVTTSAERRAYVHIYRFRREVEA